MGTRLGRLTLGQLEIVKLLPSASDVTSAHYWMLPSSLSPARLVVLHLWSLELRWYLGIWPPSKPNGARVQG